MKAQLAFIVELEYQKTVYENLVELGLSHRWGDGKSTWVFKYSDLKQVETLLGTIIEIPGFREKFDKEKIVLPRFKGKDFVEILVFPKIYQIVEHRKQESGKVKEIKHSLPKVVVDKVWNDVIIKQQINKPIKTRTVAENIVKAFKIDRFNRNSGTFDFAKFFGNRKDYYKYFYLPAKILVHLGKIKHHKDGKIERII